MSIKRSHTTAQAKKEIKEIISQEVAKAPVASLSHFKEYFGNTISQTIKEELITNFTRRVKEVTYSDFSACDPPSYSRERNPFLCHRWIQDVEGTFDRSKCPDNLRVKFTANLLRGRAKEWWNYTLAAIGPDTENQSQNGSDGENGNGGNGNGKNENPDKNGRGDRHVARECTYQDFMKCQPLNFKGTKGVVGLIRWFEKMETVFHISNCPKKSQVKYATCTLLDGALTWWNSHKRTIGTEATFAMSWIELMKLMTEVYCPRNKIQKMETELTHKTTRCCSDCQQLDRSKVEGLCCQNVARAYVASNNEKKEYKVKNQNCGNKERVPDARGKAYVLEGGDANLGSNTVTGTFLLNGHHAYMLFDTGADRIFVSNTFSALVDITSSGLDVSYAVELADGRTLETNTVLSGCTLGLLGHPFNIDLMPIDLGSFDVIIGMDWLAKNHAVIVYDEKIVRIPYANEILIGQGDKSDKETKSTLSIISCVKAQKYIKKSCQLFLAQVMVKETEDKLKKKRLKDVSTIRDFSEVFPEDLPGLPPIRQVEFQIDLVPCAAPVARAPYRLAPSKMEELSTQL
ncbi:putative reverse transcriptase domain-containing protein [Tanacetum coccineum]|uniref:Reverse transcriptase domain-containing protein n=1 Tax=Tanacetum coccineum TaxID=301880 RepID=A0ABQ4X5H7_9ASTR